MSNSTRGLILITGANGFIGSWVCKTSLDSGYSVRAVVRTSAKGDALRELFRAHSAKLEIAIVADQTAPGAFDEAVKGPIVGVIHTAATTKWSKSVASEVIPATVGSTTGLLNSLKAHSTSAKRFIYLSSAQTLLGWESMFHLYDETDWNFKAVAAAFKEDATGQTIYAASKVLAEQLCFGFAKEHAGAITFDVTSVVPAFVFGPLLSAPKSPDGLNESTAFLRNCLVSPPPGEAANGYCVDFVDVRDLAKGLVKTLQTPGAGGQRVLLDAAAVTFQNIYNVLNTAPALPNVPKGDPATNTLQFPGSFVACGKSLELLGIKFESTDITLRDAVKSLIDNKLL